MLSFLGWIIIGFLAGLLARALVPGRQDIGFLMTIVLGMVGSLAGGMIYTAISGRGPDPGSLQRSGLIWSTVGSVLVLLAYLSFSKKQVR
jgi:uncharacterized membrane protein YeaQ/YmgE (transglycosylase-associated protein family)